MKLSECKLGEVVSTNAHWPCNIKCIGHITGFREKEDSDSVWVEVTFANKEVLDFKPEWLYKLSDLGY